MRYKIVYDRPGRMRVRCGAGVFTAEQGYGIADLLREGADAHKVGCSCHSTQKEC